MSGSEADDMWWLRLLMAVGIGAAASWYVPRSVDAQSPTVASQPAPPVANGESGKQPQRQPDGTNQQATSDQRGTAQSPLFVQVLPTKKTDDETARDEQERNEKASYDKWTLIVAIAGTGVFLAQLAVFGLQARRLRQTIEAMREIDKRQSGVAERQTGVAERQTLLIGAQTDLMEKQKEIARQGHLATHRPKIAVRNIVVRPVVPSMTTRTIGVDFPKRGEPLTGQLYAANYGGGDAWITESLIWVIWLSSNLPMERPYEGQNGSERQPPILVYAGSSQTLTFESSEAMQEHGPQILPNLDLQLYVMGWIEYRDGAFRDGQFLTRRTAFCRRYDSDKRRFVRIQDEDYEHEE